MLGNKEYCDSVSRFSALSRHPEQNGRHERMHLTLKNEATKPAAFYLLQQHERFDNFIGVYNNERPHLPRTTQDQPQLCVRWPNYWRTRGHDYIWLVSFLEYDLGYFDRERDRVEPDPSPFTPDKVLTMSPVRT